MTMPPQDLSELGSVNQADVYKSGQLAAHLARTKDGVQFTYTSDYLASNSPPVAISLPKSDVPRLIPAGGVPHSSLVYYLKGAGL